MVWFRSLVVLAGGVLLVGSACDRMEPHACTDIGCSSGVFLSIAPESGVWPEGKYRLELELDAGANACELAVSADLPALGSVTSVRCGDGVDVMLQQRAHCTELREGGSVRQSCEPVPDQYDLIISAFTEASALQLALTRDGATLLSENRELDYQEFRPNGPDCEPVCRQAHLELTFGD